MLEIIDDGPGVPLDHQAQLFEPFFTTSQQGTGLGFICPVSCAKAIRRAWTSSHARMAAAFALPLLTDGNKVEHEPTAKVLIVDDEPDIRELLEITLGRMKLDTYSARNVGEAQALLKRETFDLCLTDMRLPDGTGLELVQHIQQRYPQLPVAMITAYGNLETAINALKAGAFDFLSKPVDLAACGNWSPAPCCLLLPAALSIVVCSAIRCPCATCANRSTNWRAARRRSTSAASPAAARSWSRA
jgi:CheY-like chemotaxis protein